MSANYNKFSGYQWDYFLSLSKGPIRSRAECFLKSVNWSALQDYVTSKRDGINCSFLPQVGLGGNHMVRIIEFADGCRWVARLKLPPLTKSDFSEKTLENTVIREFNTISLLRQKTSIPIPEVHAFEARSDCTVNAPLMLMDCLEGNVGMDLGMEIPPKSKQEFLRGLAKIHVQLSTVQLPKIGTILSMSADGTCQQGPIPGLGGPFDLATEFFEAWAAQAEFRMSNEQLQAASGEYADEIVPSVSSFPHSVARLASRLSTRDHGPFPLCHGDFGHNNTIVDDDYHILGVIDWEMAFAAPWEVFGDFPLSFSTVPPVMDAPWNYNEDGSPKSAELAQKFADQRDYVAAVKEEENRSGGNAHCLSEALKDSKRQQLVAAMRLFEDGKVGLYSKVIDQFVAQS